MSSSSGRDRSEIQPELLEDRVGDAPLQAEQLLQDLKIAEIVRDVYHCELVAYYYGGVQLNVLDRLYRDGVRFILADSFRELPAIFTLHSPKQPE